MDFKKDLTNNILPFWLKNAIDKKNGGILHKSAKMKVNVYHVTTDTKYVKEKRN